MCVHFVNCVMINAPSINSPRVQCEDNAGYKECVVDTRIMIGTILSPLESFFDGLYTLDALAAHHHRQSYNPVNSRKGSGKQA